MTTIQSSQEWQHERFPKVNEIRFFNVVKKAFCLMKTCKNTIILLFIQKVLFQDNMFKRFACHFLWVSSEAQFSEQTNLVCGKFFDRLPILSQLRPKSVLHSLCQTHFKIFWRNV